MGEFPVPKGVPMALYSPTQPANIRCLSHEGPFAYIRKTRRWVGGGTEILLNLTKDFGVVGGVQNTENRLT